MFDPVVMVSLGFGQGAYSEERFKIRVNKCDLNVTALFEITKI